MNRLCVISATVFLVGVLFNASFGETAYQVKAGHPRLFVEDVQEMARQCDGPLAEDYRVVKQRADDAVRRGGIQSITNGWSIPEDLMNCGLAYLVERQKGRDARQYADVIIKQWGDGTIISNPRGSQFGYHAIAYDWIYDALTPEQRVRFGDALGTWLRFFTNEPRILLKWGHWEYNQTWGPIHLNIMNSRDAITQKLFIALAISGASTRYEADARSFLNSWAERVPTECIPAFNRMGGVWSESYGHGSYGPVTVIPYAFQAWRSATGIDLFKLVKPWGYPAEEPRWVAYTMMPRKAEIVLRGGPGQEAWGHPLEPTAQYNHMTEGRKRPPICPWRIEVADPDSGSRTLFLHVFEVTDEGVRQPTALEFSAPAGVNIGQRWQIRFNQKGSLGGTVNGKPLTTSINTEKQYQ